MKTGDILPNCDKSRPQETLWSRTKRDPKRWGTSHGPEVPIAHRRRMARPSAHLVPHEANLCRGWLESCLWLWEGHRMRTLRVLTGFLMDVQYVHI